MEGGEGEWRVGKVSGGGEGEWRVGKVSGGWEDLCEWRMVVVDPGACREPL